MERKSGKPKKSQAGKKMSKKNELRLKDLQSKERLIFEERLRLHDETVKNQMVIVWSCQISIPSFFN